MYSCIQESLGGLSKCLPTRLLITTEKSPDTDINFYTRARTQTRTHRRTFANRHAHTQIICSSPLIYKWMTGGRSTPICVFSKLNTLICSVFFCRYPWRNTRSHNFVEREQTKKVWQMLAHKEVLACFSLRMFCCSNPNHVSTQIRWVLEDTSVV